MLLVSRAAVYAHANTKRAKIGLFVSYYSGFHGQSVFDLKMCGFLVLKKCGFLGYAELLMHKLFRKLLLGVVAERGHFLGPQLLGLELLRHLRGDPIGLLINFRPGLLDLRLERFR